MKTKSVILAAAIAASQFSLAAFAQSSSTQKAAKPMDISVTEPGLPAAAATSVATAPAAKSKVGVSYLGIMNGPGLSNEFEGKTKDGEDLYLNNRPSIKYTFDENTDAGLQARFNLKFQNDGMDVVNDSWRVFANFKNVYKDDVLSLNITPRIFLPTKLSSHNATMLPSPEIIPVLNISPKNSRFSLSVYPQVIQWLYSDNAVAASKAANSLYVIGNFEGTYQLAAPTAITFGFYPEYISGKTRAMRNTSNELDLGVSYDFAKGWSVNPYIATEFIGMGADNASISKNMAFNVILSGAIL